MNSLEQNNIVLPKQTSWFRRIWSYPAMEHYYRLMFLVLVMNLATLLYGVVNAAWFSAQSIALLTIANMVVLNLTVAVLVRQQYVINFLFWLATRAPTSYFEHSLALREDLSPWRAS